MLPAGQLGLSMNNLANPHRGCSQMQAALLVSDDPRAGVRAGHLQVIGRAAAISVTGMQRKAGRSVATLQVCHMCLVVMR